MATLTLVIWLICAAVCATMAGNKGYVRWHWAIWGGLFGIFAILVMACKKPNPSVSSQDPVS